MMNFFKINCALIAVIVLLFPLRVVGDEDIQYQDWIVQVRGDSVEAHTRSVNNASLGFYCKDEVCFFYINFNATCPIGAYSSPA